MHIPKHEPKKQDIMHEKLGDRFSIYELISRAKANGIPVDIVYDDRKDKKYERKNNK